MLDKLLQIDKEWFLAINNGMANDFFDALMPVLRNQYTWVPLYILIAGWFLYRYKIQGFWFIAFTLITFALSDQLSASLIKPFIERLRPCREPFLIDQVRILVHCGSGHSFPSTHATNHFAFAIIVGLCLYKDNKWPIYALLAAAVLVSFAQVYVGVHYPIDVISGAILGTIIASVVWLIGSKIKKQAQK
jgi:membrane-associated phospholipid phosphatase